MFLIYLLLILLASTLVRSTFGFGESLVAVPLLTFLMPIEEAVPLSVAFSVLIAAVIVLQDGKKIQFFSAKWLVIFAIVGLPLGIFILTYADEDTVKLGLGILIVLYALYALFSNRNFYLESDSKVLLFVCGLISGVFGGAYGLNGPSLVVYGNLRKWSAQHFRATLQGYFLIIGLITMGGYFYKGLWKPALTHDFLWGLIVVIPAIFIGRKLNLRFEGEAFRKWVYWGLIIIGALLIFQY